MAWNIQDVLDPTASITENLEPNAQLVPDESGEYTRIVFLGEERERFGMYLKLMLQEIKKFYQPLYRKHAKNKAAYEAIGSRKEAITLTLVRSTVNQQHALLVNKFFSKAPTLFRGIAIGDKKTEIIIPPELDANGQQIAPAKPDTIDSEDEAAGIADWTNYRWLHRLQMRQVVSDTIMEALQSGVFPAIAKVVVTDGQSRYMKDNILTKRDNPASPVGYDIVYDKEQRTVDGCERVQIKAIPSERFIKKPGPESINETEFCGLEYEESRRVTRKRIASGRYDFCLPRKGERDDAEQELFEKLAEAAVMGRRKEPEQGGSRIASKPVRDAHGESGEAFSPTSTNTNFELYTRWPILTPDEVKAAKAEKRDPQIIEMEIVCDYQSDIDEPLSCWELPWWSGTRPFEDFFMHQRPGSYSGNSTGEDVAPYQRYMSQLFHLQMQNLVLQNQSAIFIVEGAPCWEEIGKSGRRVRPGFAYKIAKPDDVQIRPLGTQANGLNEQIAFLKQMAQELALVTQWDTATAPLTRVTAGAFSQQQTLAKMQPEFVYENFCNFAERLALKDLQACIQFAPDQHVPDFAAKSKAIIDNVLHLPRRMVTDADIRLQVVATTDDETKANELAQATQISAEIQKANNATLEGLGAVLKPGIPPQFVDVALRLIARSEDALGQILKNIRSDYNNFIITESDIRKISLSLQQMAAQLGGGSAPPPQPAQQPQQPNVNISLKGVLTQQETDAIVGQQSGGAAGAPGAPGGAPQGPPPQQPPAGPAPQ